MNLRTCNTTLACFSCRTALKIGPWDGICTRCGTAMIDMGKRFHAPPKRDVKQWRKIEAMLEHTWNWFKTHDSAVLRGERCHCNGCQNRGVLPKTLTEAKGLYGMRRNEKKDWQAPPKKARNRSGPRQTPRRVIEARARSAARKALLEQRMTEISD